MSGRGGGRSGGGPQSRSKTLAQDVANEVGLMYNQMEPEEPPKLYPHVNVKLPEHTLGDDDIPLIQKHRELVERMKRSPFYLHLPNSENTIETYADRFKEVSVSDSKSLGEALQQELPADYFPTELARQLQPKKAKDAQTAASLINVMNKPVVPLVGGGRRSRSLSLDLDGLEDKEKRMRNKDDATDTRPSQLRRKMSVVSEASEDAEDDDDDDYAKDYYASDIDEGGSDDATF